MKGNLINMANDMTTPENIFSNSDEDFSNELLNIINENEKNKEAEAIMVDTVRNPNVEAEEENLTIATVASDSGLTIDTSDISPIANEEPVNPDANIITTEPKGKTPLEKFMEAKSKAPQGLVIDNEELRKGADGPKKNIAFNDMRLDAIEKTLSEQDELFEKRKLIVPTKLPADKLEYTKLIDEISHVEVGPDGKARFDYKDANGNLVDYQPVFCRIRTEKDLPYDEDEAKRLNPTFIEAHPEQAELLKKQLNPDYEIGSKENTSSVSTGNDDVEEADDSEKKRTIEIIIDKTGLGADFNFTDEEREKIESAEVIKLTEVSNFELSAITGSASEKSFSEVLDDFDYSGARTTLAFPSSGFKAQMRGMSYGEYSDIALSMESVDVDVYHKRLSVIYNNMTNVSCGKFESFEDFLKNFAYSDIQLALYGLYVSTQAEEEDIPLKCNNEGCGKSFNWKFAPRGVIKLDRCADTFLEKYRELIMATPDKYDEIHKKSAVMSPKYIKLPKSGFVCELGIASAYEFLYNFIPLMNPDTFKAAFGTDVTDAYAQNILLLTTVRSIYVPDGEGKWIHCTGYKDILDAIYKVTTEEIKIIAKYTNDIQSQYEISFSLGEVKCPHCGHITPSLDIDMDTLVFQTYGRLMNTEINLQS
jgi:hypothetical protein